MYLNVMGVVSIFVIMVTLNIDQRIEGRMAKQALNAEVLEKVIEQTQTYLLDELDVSLGKFEVQFLVEHIIKQIGPDIYNQAIDDSMKELTRSMDSVVENLDFLKDI
ncbi:DUF2164 family protein [Marinomonas sp. 2405UD68-3]|uniref:DUF2164 family protein n=1 Tax=Marinomonas sp. 2405UD68-3 TaxID=3391835 RepID=UPI0039C9DF33